MRVYEVTKGAVAKDLPIAKRVIKNLSELVDAACIAGVTGFGIYEALKHNGNHWYELLLFAGLLVALQAFVLLVRFFNYEK